jgi:Inosine-uridine preferring nucleoside hydrolase
VTGFRAVRVINRRTELSADGPHRGGRRLEDPEKAPGGDSNRERPARPRHRGVEDALALLYLADAQYRRRVSLVGCGTVAGNVEVERTTRNTLKLLELLELAVPVAAGAGRPMRGPLHPGDDRRRPPPVTGEAAGGGRRADRRRRPLPGGVPGRPGALGRSGRSRRPSAAAAARRVSRSGPAQPRSAES